MLVRYFSDLHLDFSPINIREGAEDVVILAGDACQGSGGIRWLASRFPNKHKIFLAGNHEYYGQTDMIQLQVEMRTLGNKLKVSTLIYPGDHLMLDGILFAGSTLWTNYGAHHGTAFMEVAKEEIRYYMNDYAAIKIRPGVPVTPDDLAAYHDHELDGLTRVLSMHRDMPTVVITHHCPSEKSIAVQYLTEANRYVNYGFTSDLNHVMHSHPQIRYWVHGHTHTSFDYMIAQTRVLCNPRGYQHHRTPYPENRKFDPNAAFTI